MSHAFGSLTLSQQARDNLLRLIGAKYDGLGGSAITHSKLAQEVFVFSSQGAVEISGVLKSLDFEGYVDEYSRFEVERVEPTKANRILESGEFFAQSSGDEIRDIYVVRETITQVKQGTPVWSLKADSGIVLALGNSYIAFALQALFDVVFAFDFLERFSLQDMDDLTTLYEDDLLASYMVSRELISVSNIHGEA
jgi:hypothetical protein